MWRENRGKYGGKMTGGDRTWQEDKCGEKKESKRGRRTNMEN